MTTGATSPSIARDRGRLIPTQRPHHGVPAKGDSATPAAAVFVTAIPATKPRRIATTTGRQTAAIIRSGVAPMLSMIAMSILLAVTCASAAANTVIRMTPHADIEKTE